MNEIVSVRKIDEYKTNGKIVSVDEYRVIQSVRHPKRKKIKDAEPKKHTSLRMTTTGSVWEIVLDSER